MDSKQLAKEFAQALQESDMSPLEKEEWVVFSSLMTEKQISEWIELLKKQKAEQKKEN